MPSDFRPWQGIVGIQFFALKWGTAKFALEVVYQPQPAKLHFVGQPSPHASDLGTISCPIVAKLGVAVLILNLDFLKREANPF